MDKKVFISSATADSAFVDDLREALFAAGLDVFLPERQIRPGESWTERIEASIGSAEVILFVLSPHSSQSEWVRTEVALAVSEVINHEGTVIIPIIAERPFDLPFFLRHLQYVDLSSQENYRENISNLLEAITAAGEGSSQDAQSSARLRVLEIRRRELLFENEAESVRLEARLSRVGLYLQIVATSIAIGVGGGLVSRNVDGLIGWIIITVGISMMWFSMGLDELLRGLPNSIGSTKIAQCIAMMIRSMKIK